MTQNALAVKQTDIPVMRNFALRFPTDEPQKRIIETLSGWNQRLKLVAGVGYFGGDPEIEMFTDEGGHVVGTYTYYLMADLACWEEFLNSRTVTPDEPVLSS